MAHRLVPCSQDEEWWVNHYMAQAMKQVKRKDMLKPVKETTIHPKYVLPTAQLVAQAESEMKHEKKEKEMPVFTPIKATPESTPGHTLEVVAKQSGSRKRKAAESTSSTSKKRKKQQQQQQARRKQKTGKHSAGEDILY